MTERDLDPIIRAAVDALSVEERPRPIPASAARTVVAKAVHDAYTLGRDEALRGLRSSTEVAAELGITRLAVGNMARRLGLGRVVAGVLVLTPADVEALRQRPKPGRPPRKREASE